MQTHSRIEERASLTHDAIKRLMEDETLVLIIKNYYSTQLAKKLANQFIQSEKLEQYTHEVVYDNELKQEYFGVDRVGFPFNLIYDNDQNDSLALKYYAEAPVNMARIRSYTAPALTPIDKLRLELDEKYLHGAMVARFQTQKMLAGIGRVTHAALSHLSEDEPHFDALPEKFCQLDGQFACNIYLTVPKKGGELEVWDVKPMSPLATAPANWRKQLPQSVTLKPNEGDLILFNCRRPHAIRRFKGEPRVTMQTFIGYRKTQPLLIWN